MLKVLGRGQHSESMMRVLHLVTITKLQTMKIQSFAIIITLVFMSDYAVSQDCGPSTAYEELDINNIRAGLRVAGDLWWDGLGEGRYVAPKNVANEDPVSALFSGALWLSGVDLAGNIKVAAQRYPSGNITDYWAGPLDENGEISNESCANWDRFFKVDRSEIEAHIQDYAVDGIIGSKRLSIYDWPGRNSPVFEEFAGYPLPENTRLAPYMDLDGDFIYEPDDGEYPLIKGDQAVWWVFNDAGNIHFETGLDPLHAEVQVMAFAEQSEIAAVDNTTFYQYKIINKGSEVLHDFNMSLWVDPDLGCYADDYIGYDSIRHMAYVYNEDAIDGSNDQGECPGGISTYGNKIPMVGIARVHSSITEEATSSFISELPPGPIWGDPVPWGYSAYNILNGLWENGLALTYGGSGQNIGSTDTVNYLFPDDPSDTLGWSLCTADLPYADRRFVMSTGGDVLLPGKSVEVTYAVIFVEDVPHPCPSLEVLQAAHDQVLEHVELTTHVTTSINVFDLSVFPNPTSGLCNLSLSASTETVLVVDMTGRVVGEFSAKGSNTRLDISDLPNGIYQVIAQSRTGEVIGLARLIKAD